MKNENDLKRRAFLQKLCALGIALPVAKALLQEKEAQAQALPKRIVFFYSPLGTALPDWDVTGEGRNLKLGPILKPHEAWKEDLLILRGLQLSAAGNHGGVQSVFSGASMAKESQRPNTPSLDYVLGQRLGTATKLNLLQAGIRTGVEGGGDVGFYCTTWADANVPLMPVNNPLKLYKILFGDPSALQNANAAAAEKALQTQRQLDKLFLDHSRSEISALAGSLGKQELAKTDQHLLALKSLEKRLALATPTQSNSCHIPIAPLGAISEDPSFNNSTSESFHNLPEIADAHLDLMVEALACDLTRVATFQFMHEATDARYPFLPGVPDERAHDMSHHPEFYDSDGPMSRISQWHSRTIASFISKLKARNEGSGTLYDNTLIVWGMSMSNGYVHSSYDVPYLLINGKWNFKTGRQVDFRNPESPVANNGLLISLAQAMGLNDVTKFGFEEFSKGPLPGLT